MAHLTLCAFESALSAGPGNGGGAPTAEVRFVLARLAVAAPRTALRCPRVRAALPPEALATVFALAGDGPATAPAPPAPGAADSVLTAAEAAEAASVTGAAIRAAAGRGALPGRKGPDGRWRFKRNDVERYRRAHGRG
jgi:hypothetical protein